MVIHVHNCQHDSRPPEENVHQLQERVGCTQRGRERGREGEKTVQHWTLYQVYNVYQLYNLTNYGYKLSQLLEIMNCSIMSDMSHDRTKNTSTSVS